MGGADVAPRAGGAVARNGAESIHVRVVVGIAIVASPGVL